MEIDPNQILHRLASGAVKANMVIVEEEIWSKTTSFWLLIISKLKDDQVDIPKLILLASPTSCGKNNYSNSMEYITTTITKPLRASMLQVSLRQAINAGDGEPSQNGRLPQLSLRSLLHDKQILVVDDNVVNLRVAAGALKKFGAEVTCQSGRKAISMPKLLYGYSDA